MSCWVSGAQGCYRLTRGRTGPSQFREWVALDTGVRFPSSKPLSGACDAVMFISLISLDLQRVLGDDGLLSLLQEFWRSRAV